MPKEPKKKNSAGNAGAKKPSAKPGRQPVPRDVDGLTAVQAQRKEQILQAAIQVYCHYGYYGTTLQKVADAVGCANTLVLHYFGTMEALAKEATLRITGELVAELERIWQQDCRSYAENVEKVFGYFQGTRTQWRFLIGLLNVPALESFSRGLNLNMLEQGERAILRYSEDIDTARAFALTYLMTAHYFGYIVGGSEQNYRSARDAFFPHFLTDPSTYDPYRGGLAGGDILPDNSSAEQAGKHHAKTIPQRDARREQIIQYALKVFGRYGYYGTSIDKIAMTAGVSRSLIFKYCGPLEETARLCAQHFVGEFFRRLEYIHKKIPSYPDQSEHILDLVRTSRDEWRFVVGMLTTPALEQTAREICGKHFAALVPMCRQSCAGVMPAEQIPAFAYSVTAIYLAYICGGNEENFLRGREEIYNIYLK